MSMIATLRRAWDGSLGVWFARLRLRARRGTHRLFIGAPPVDPLVPYRHIALQLNYEQRRDADTRAVLCTSPEGGRIYAGIVARIARGLAEVVSSQVLLVSCGGRESDLREELGLPASDFEESGAEVSVETLLSERVQQQILPGVDHLTLGLPRIGGPLNRNDVANIGLLISAARERYDFVVVHGGSALRDSFALSAAKHVGRVLLMSVENVTRRMDLEHAQRNFELARVTCVSHLLIQAEPGA